MTETPAEPQTAGRRDAAGCDMRCQFCHERVVGRPARCPHCGYQIGDGDDDAPRHSGASLKIRVVILGAVMTLFALQLTGRMPGCRDTTAPARPDARKKVSDALVSLEEGRYDEAQAMLNEAVALDEGFAEAWLVRGLAHLALGDPVQATADALRGQGLLDAGKADKAAWKKGDGDGAARGRCIAERTLCVADAEGMLRLDASASARLFVAMREVSEARDRASARTALERWRSDGVVYRALAQAVADCPTLWPCEAP